MAIIILTKIIITLIIIKNKPTDKKESNPTNYSNKLQKLPPIIAYGEPCGELHQIRYDIIITNILNNYIFEKEAFMTLQLANEWDKIFEKSDNVNRRNEIVSLYEPKESLKVGEVK